MKLVARLLLTLAAVSSASGKNESSAVPERTQIFDGYIFEGISDYSVFRECMGTVKKLENFFEFYSRKFYSGFYEGQWMLIEDEGFEPRESPAGQRNYTLGDGLSKLNSSYPHFKEGDQLKNQLLALGPYFVKRGYP